MLTCFVFYENLEAAEKKDKTKQSLPQYFTRMTEQRTLWQKKIAVGLGLLPLPQRFQSTKTCSRFQVHLHHT